MILLTSTSDLIQVITASAVTSTHMHASYTDYNGSSVTPGRTNTSINTAATTSIVGSPGSSTQRNVKSMVIRNTHASSSNVVTVQHTDGSTTATLVKCTLGPGESLQYFDKDGFIVFDASGGRKSAPATGRLVNETLLTSASANFTTGPLTNLIKVRIQAGGAQGGGGLGGSSTASAGGGGSAGGYAEKWFAVSPNTAYAYTCGAGGSTSTGQTTGQDGTDSTFVVGATTVTAKGGKGGLGGGTAGSTALTVLGGAPPAVSTNGDVNSSGDAGSPGIRLSGTIAVSGKGASSFFGAGGNGVITDVAGNAATGYGAGGGGATSLTAANRNGGAGAAGCIFVEEYS